MCHFAGSANWITWPVPILPIDSILCVTVLGIFNDLLQGDISIQFGEKEAKIENG